VTVEKKKRGGKDIPGVFINTVAQPDKEEEFTILTVEAEIASFETDKADIQARIDDLKSRKAAAELLA